MEGIWLVVVGSVLWWGWRRWSITVEPTDRFMSSSWMRDHIYQSGTRGERWWTE